MTSEALRKRLAQHASTRLSPLVAAALFGEATTAVDAPAAVEAPALPASFVALADLYPSLLAGERRKVAGAWFTPDSLAQPTAERTLLPLLQSRGPSLRIVDPAVGGGTFLRAALRTLRTAGLTPAQAVGCLHGVDLDPTAAALAALAVWEAAGDRSLDPLQLAERIRAGDGLTDLAAGTFDAVLTNPPWETMQTGTDAPARVRALRPRFHHQGRGKLFTYRLFVERAHQLLREGGRLGLVVPASLWFDRDAEPLRRLLLDECAWEWLFGMENRRKVFAIDSRYRFGVVIAAKGGRTTAVRAAFDRVDPSEWAKEEPPHVLWSHAELGSVSPRSGAFAAIEHRRDLEILQRMHARGRPLLGEQGVCTWRQGDFNMTSDRGQFVLRSEAEANGWNGGPDGVWRRAGHGDLLALWQGAMVYDLEPNTGAHVRGTGHETTWAAPADRSRLQPLYLVDAQAWRASALQRCRARLVLRALSNATNERTAIACLLPDVPCGNSLGVLEPRLASATPLRELATVAAVLSSLAFDHALRLRLSGTNLNAFVLGDCVLPELDAAVALELAKSALHLCASVPVCAGLWEMARSEGWVSGDVPTLDAVARRSLYTSIDVLVGRAFGLTTDDVAWITRDDPSNARGFWRLDREVAAADRRPTRWLKAVTNS
ncbi:MAG: N-6 DNA methylase [Planctomycetes bacterium]|nr:N-6 DNA methylase [Planctomycetota bacterium]